MPTAAWCRRRVPQARGLRFKQLWERETHRRRGRGPPLPSTPPRIFGGISHRLGTMRLVMAGAFVRGRQGTYHAPARPGDLHSDRRRIRR